MPRSVRHLKLETRTARARLPARRAPYFLKVARACGLAITAATAQALGSVGAISAPLNTKPRRSELLTTPRRPIAWLYSISGRRRTLYGAGPNADALPSTALCARAPTRSALRLRTIWPRSPSRTTVGGQERPICLQCLGAAEARPSARRAADLEQITRWRNELATSGKRVRSKKRAEKPTRRPLPTTDGDRRKRRATANRVLSMLKAALNRAYNAGRVANDEAWRKVRPFKQANEPVVGYLSEDEARRLVNACEKDFRPLVQAALLTGCRYSELVNLCCADFNRDSDTLTLRQTSLATPACCAD